MERYRLRLEPKLRVDAQFGGMHYQFVSAVHAEFEHHIADVPCTGLWRNAQAPRRFFDRPAMCQEIQDIELAFRQIGVNTASAKAELVFHLFGSSDGRGLDNIEIHDDGQRNADARANCKANLGYILRSTQVMGRKPKKTVKWGICAIDSVFRGALCDWLRDTRQRQLPNAPNHRLA